MSFSLTGFTKSFRHSIFAIAGCHVPRTVLCYLSQFNAFETDAKMPETLGLLSICSLFLLHSNCLWPGPPQRTWSFTRNHWGTWFLLHFVSFGRCRNLSDLSSPHPKSLFIWYTLRGHKMSRTPWEELLNKLIYTLARSALPPFDLNCIVGLQLALCNQQWLHFDLF